MRTAAGSAVSRQRQIRRVSECLILWILFGSKVQVPRQVGAFSLVRRRVMLSIRTYLHPLLKGSPEDAVEFQVHEDGGLRIFFSRLSDRLGDSQEEVVLDVAIVNYTRRFLALVLAAGEISGYFGNWALAIGATGLNGLRAGPTQGSWLGASPQARFDEDTYALATEATWAELNNTPGAITQRLAGRFVRALGVEPRHQSLLND